MHGPHNVQHFERKTRSSEKPQLTLGVPGSIILKLGPQGPVLNTVIMGDFKNGRKFLKHFQHPDHESCIRGCA